VRLIGLFYRMASHVISPEEQKQIDKLGERICAYRKALGYTSYENFAVAKNLNRVQYWRYENGENMKILNLAKVAKALEIPLEELVKGIFD